MSDVLDTMQQLSTALAATFIALLVFTFICACFTNWNIDCHFKDLNTRLDKLEKEREK